MKRIACMHHGRKRRERERGTRHQSICLSLLSMTDDHDDEDGGGIWISVLLLFVILILSSFDVMLGLLLHIYALLLRYSTRIAIFIYHFSF